MHHQNLLKELKAIGITRQDKKGQKFLELVKEKRYNKALLYACENCKSTNSTLFKFVEILLQYREHLSIDVNTRKVTDKKTPVIYAAENRSNGLFFLLKKAGANANLQDIHSRSADDIYYENGGKAVQFLLTQLKEDFNKERIELDSLYAQLPDKNKFLTDEENAQFDLERLEYISRRVDFLVRYFSNLDNGNQLPVTCKLSQYQQENLYNLGVQLARNYLAEIGTTVQNLSGETRGKYSKLFSPVPFTWITLEQLGGIMKFEPQNNFISLPVRDLSDKQSSHCLPFTKRFFAELADTAEVLEEAIPDIINLDMPAMKKFFEEVYTQEKNQLTDSVAPVSLVATKALTGRIGDNKNILSLLNLLNYSENTISPPQKGSSPYTPVTGNPPPIGKEYQQKFDLSKKSGRHAALRRLQLIGELFTGKNFSSELFDLDDSIDWRALITIRDGITHQDERDNKEKIDTLLSDQERLKKIVGEEVSDLWFRLHNILESREKLIGPYDNDAKAYWKKILAAQQEKSAPKIEEAEVEIIKRRVSEKEEEQFLSALMEHKTASVEIQNRCRAIFDGTGPLPNKMEVGTLLQHLPPRKDDREKYSQLAKIMTKATANKSSQEERNQKRQQIEEAAKKRELERESKYKGLNNIRALAQNLLQSPRQEHMLNPKKRINAAIEAINNLEEFLIEMGCLKLLQSWKVLEKSDCSTKIKSLLAALLASNPELNDALAYNAGQALQHLDRIRELDVAQLSKYLGKEYENLRALRNYIEHGDHLMDHPGQVCSQPLVPREHQQIIASVIIKLIFELGPDLLKMKEALLNPVDKEKSILPGVPVCDAKSENILSNEVSEKKESISSASGEKGLEFGRFFAPQKAEEGSKNDPSGSILTI
ncbi:ankyrin repeat domain-containing protein [Legionella maioricensis]|uniref:Ankyrin repeat domain-containing protein n=1 Tax=Legionella maioricensis TaxID=2896528 RepID=A0A9X2IAW8_9GAMM|nr:ankyrin repeat domain-containing protein [Legionella maioricensis]MCL9683721.1 ankyrin repeat domain-containing protein [Legionella maioricensis]MCL9687495.1 ankyrin repeat domain-containing protein [Legionella maioricensis]